MRALVGLIQAAARQLDPLVLQEMVRSVGAQLGRQALSEYRLMRHAGGRLDGYTWAECLKEIGEQFGWTLRVSVESDGVIRVTVLGCECAKSDESASYLCEFSSGLFGGAMAEAIGDVKVCVSRCAETPPLHCAFAIYYRTSKESVAASGVDYPRISDRPAPRAKEPLGSRLGARLTAREAQILQAIAQGLPDKEIATSLQLSVRTVENHAARIRKKLRIGNRAALVRFALHNRLVDA
jgi:DNA-binding CsgD family transcriptional regulator